MKRLMMLLWLPLAGFAMDRPSFDMVAAEVGLDDGQRDQVKELTYKFDKDKIQIEARLRGAEHELHHHLDADKLDEKAVRKALDALTAAEADLKRNRIELVIELRRILSAEQWRKLDAMHKQHPPAPPAPPAPPSSPGYSPQPPPAPAAPRFSPRPPAAPQPN